MNIPNPVEGGRDLRIDLLRGAAVVAMVVVHIEIFSLWNLLAWERVGVVSGAEAFVILSGLVLGMVYRKRLERDGWRPVVLGLLDRLVQIYRANLWLIVLAGLAMLLPWIDAAPITTFVDRGAHQVWPLYPAAGTAPLAWASRVALLRAGPHQGQVLGLYVVLLALAPLGLWLLQQKRTGILLGLSWVVYLRASGSELMPTGTQFEYAFPVLVWQILFFHGLAVGWHWEGISAFAQTRRGHAVIAVSAGIAAALCFFALNTTNALMPAWGRLSIIPAATFDAIYGAYCQKESLGLLRMLDDAALLVAAYALLTRFWPLAYRVVGWALVPLGQASLYAILVHVGLVLVVGNLLPFGFDGTDQQILVNTLAHTLSLAALVTMVRRKFLFRWIPR